MSQEVVSTWEAFAAASDLAHVFLLRWGQSVCLLVTPEVFGVEESPGALGTLMWSIAVGQMLSLVTAGGGG